MTPYPGNPALGDEVRQRIVATYEQSLDLAERGRRQEALLGCDFILELDPQFAPARTLRERLAEAGEPDLADLRHPGGGSGEEAAMGGGRPEESFSDLFDLDSLELPELEEPPPPPPATDPAALAAELRRRLEERDFQGVLDRAARDSATVTADPGLAGIAETARARLEARPYVESFLEKAGAALRTGDAERAEQMLDKARSLDPDHPLLEDLEATLGRERPGGPAGGEPAAPYEPGSSGPSLGLGDEEILGGYELPDMDALPSFEAPDLDEPAWDAPEPASPPAAPGAPAPAPEVQGDDRIAQLLAEGQRAADEGRFQEAIDSWSRIFLIDVDHAEAARRIEQARRSKAEREREVEEVFHEGLAALEGGDRDTARQRFERVLEMQPSHLAARSYLSQLESGESVDVRPPGPTGAETVALGELGSFDLADLATPRGREAPPGDLKEEILVPPPPGAEGAAREGAAASGALPSYGKAVAGREPGRRTFLLVGGLVLVLVLAAAAVLYVRKDSLFPNSDVEEPAAEAAPEAGAPGAIERAVELQERGQTAMALGLLRRIRPDDPRYEEARELIARWETPPEPAAAAGVPPEALARRTRLLRAAEAAIQGERYLLAEQLYDRAAQIAELEGDHRDRLEGARAEIAPLQPEIRLFREGEYELVLPRLWRLYEEDPSNRDVRAMLVDSYYNRGVRQLQRGDPAAAADEFEEALGIDPEDPDLQRHYLFAQTYQRRPRDLLYRIYVKYLPLR